MTCMRPRLTGSKAGSRIAQLKDTSQQKIWKNSEKKLSPRQYRKHIRKMHTFKKPAQRDNRIDEGQMRDNVQCGQWQQQQCEWQYASSKVFQWKLKSTPTIKAASVKAASVKAASVVVPSSGSELLWQPRVCALSQRICLQILFNKIRLRMDTLLAAFGATIFVFAALPLFWRGVEGEGGGGNIMEATRMYGAVRVKYVTRVRKSRDDEKGNPTTLTEN